MDVRVCDSLGDRVSESVGVLVFSTSHGHDDELGHATLFDDGVAVTSKYKALGR